MHFTVYAAIFIGVFICTLIFVVQKVQKKYPKK